jgi:hypothetical protein
MKRILLVVAFGISLLISCNRTSNDAKEIEINSNKFEKESLKLNETSAELSKNKKEDIPDSLFLISPQGYILEHSENPSWESLYIFYEEGKLVNDGNLDDGNYYYRTGKWWMKKDSLYLLFEKIIYNRGIGKTIKVKPSVEFQSGEKKEEYMLTIIDTTIKKTYFWPDFKDIVMDKDNWDWQIFRNRSSSRPFSKYNLKLHGNFPELSTKKVETRYLLILKENNELSIARNEIFARYGYIFKSEELKKHFNSFDWYRPIYENVDSFLTDIEKWNIKKLLEIEKN